MKGLLYIFLLLTTAGTATAQTTPLFQAGDRLFLYTDGLTDQRDPEGCFFDSERLLALVEGDLDDDPSGVLERVFATISAFGHHHRSDDQTAMLLQVK